MSIEATKSGSGRHTVIDNAGMKEIASTVFNRAVLVNDIKSGELHQLISTKASERTKKKQGTDPTDEIDEWTFKKFARVQGIQIRASDLNAVARLKACQCHLMSFV